MTHDNSTSFDQGCTAYLTCHNINKHIVLVRIIIIFEVQALKIKYVPRKLIFLLRFCIPVKQLRYTNWKKIYQYYVFDKTVIGNILYLSWSAVLYITNEICDLYNFKLLILSISWLDKINSLTCSKSQINIITFSSSLTVSD